MMTMVQYQTTVVLDQCIVFAGLTALIVDPGSRPSAKTHKITFLICVVE